jgi:hypothetical protein
MVSDNIQSINQELINGIESGSIKQMNLWQELT